MNTHCLIIATVLLAILSVSATAETSLNNIRWNGFLNVLGSVSNEEVNYVNEIDDSGSATETNFGLSASAVLNRQLRVAGQLHMINGLARFDWGFANYSLSSSTQIRAGKIKYAGSLVSDYVDIGFSYPWIRAPESIYSEAADLSFEAYSGAGLEYATGDDTTFLLNFYGGQTSDDDEDHDKLIGIAALLSNDYGEIRLNANQSEVQSPGEPVDGEKRVILNAGIQGELNNFVLYSEYSHSEIENNFETDAWYASLGFRLGKNLPLFTYQRYEIDTGVEQSSWTLGLTHQYTSSVVLKLELQSVFDIKKGGLFVAPPGEDKVVIISTALNFVF